MTPHVLLGAVGVRHEVRTGARLRGLNLFAAPDPSRSAICSRAVNTGSQRASDWILPVSRRVPRSAQFPRFQLN